MRKIDKKIKQDFEETYNCDLTVEDILSKTDFFDTKEPSNPKQSFFSLIFSKPNLKYTLTTVLSLIIIVVGIITIPNLFMGDLKNEEYKYNEYLTYEEVDLINDNSVINEYEYYVKSEFIENMEFYFFRGITKDNKYIYFVKYRTNEDIHTLNIKVDNNNILLEEDKLNILAIRDYVEEETDNLTMYIDIEGEIVEYTVILKKIR